MKLLLTKLSLLAATLALVAGVVAPAAASASVNNYPEHKKEVYVCVLKKVYDHDEDFVVRHTPVSATFEVKKIEKDDMKPGDFLYAGPVNEEGYPDRKAGPVWCENHQPGDKCANVDGKQTEVPAGKVVDANGNCVDPTPVVVTTTTTTTPTTTTPAPQVVVPTGGVKAGAGGTASNPIAQLFGIVTSFGVVAVGFAIRKFAL